MNTEEIFDTREWLTENGGPRYLQLKQRLESLITSQALPPGTPLPPEREMAKLTGLSRVTVRKAVAPLVEAGMVSQRQGSGTVVAARLGRVEQSLSRLSSFTEDMARRGMTISQKWLMRGVFVPTHDEIMTLGLGADQMVSRLERLRVANGKPMAIERATVPNDLLPDPETVETSLYEKMEQHGSRPVRAIQHITAANLDTDDAALLAVAPGAAALRITRIGYLETGRVAEFTRSIYRGDAYDFVAELKLVDPKATPGASPGRDARQRKPGS